MSPMLAKPYTDQNPTGWLISEKLDGVRAIWDGAALPYIFDGARL